MSIFNFFQTYGYYGFAAWVPTLLIAKGITVTHQPGIRVHHRDREPCRAVDRHAGGRPMERKWQIVLRCARHCRYSACYSPAPTGAAAGDRIGRADHTVQQLAVLRVPQLPGGAVSDADPQPGRLASPTHGAGCRRQSRDWPSRSSWGWAGTTAVFVFIAICMADRHCGCFSAFGPKRPAWRWRRFLTEARSTGSFTEGLKAVQQRPSRAGFTPPSRSALSGSQVRA